MTIPRTFGCEIGAHFQTKLGRVDNRGRVRVAVELDLKLSPPAMTQLQRALTTPCAGRPVCRPGGSKHVHDGAVGPRQHRRGLNSSHDLSCN